ncbi:hypothetical protein PYW07_011875 [Mythimna separata]|uniref:Chitin-binding type-2 domain-containing protein n=1 Tax=Mythimna separata TaxID=271217 RepID=A0AAD7Y6X0_MYTSE|nr:hypothetical protein PYW07_011875 [Mythimna separata]
MFKTILLLAGIALVQARSYGEVSEEASAAPDIRTTPELGEALENGCPADFDIQFLLPHEACEKYYQCDEGEKIERDCQTGTVFNPDIQICDWPYNVPRCENSPGATAPPTTPESSDESPEPEEWEALPNGCPANFEISKLLPHESECGIYYACNQGELIEMKCPAGLHFSPSEQTCTWPFQAGCESQKVAYNVILDQEVQEEWEALPNGCPANYTIDHLLPHESNCEKFYYCVHGGKVEYDCPDATHFSPALQKCTWSEEAGCAN